MTARTAPVAPDWSLGRYESTAEQLLPAARAVIGAAGELRGARVVDIGCGTGNGALLAAELGADVLGVDPAARLLEVAERRAADARLDLEFRRGDAASIPAAAGTVDVALSVFGIVFAPDATAAAAEAARVLAPRGRLVLSAWQPGGTIAAMNEAAVTAVREAICAPPPPLPFRWSDASTLESVFGRFGFAVDVAEHALAFTAASPAHYLDGERRNHPLALAGFQLLEQRGRADSVAAALLEILEQGNEDSERFRATARYVVATLRRG